MRDKAERKNSIQRLYSAKLLLVFSLLINTGLIFFVVLPVINKKRLEATEIPFERTDFLSPQQLRWLDEHSHINLAHCRGYKPIDFWGRNKKWNGFSADYFRQLSKVLNLSYNDMTGGGVLQKLNRIKQRELDFVTSVYEQHVVDGVTYTSPYFKLPLMIFTRSENKEMIRSFNDLKGKVLGISESSNVQPFFKEHYPEIILKEYPSHGTAYLQLSHGAVDACLSTLHSGINKGVKNGLTNIVLVGKSYVDLPYVFAIRDDWPELVEIINLTIQEFEKKGNESLYKKWYGVVGRDALLSKEYLIILFGICICLILVASVSRVRKKALESEKEREREIREAKSRFFASISHDLRNPISSMIETLQLTVDEGSDMQHKDSIKSALQSSNMLLKLLNEILDFSKGEAGSIAIFPEPYDLRALIVNSSKLFQYTEKQGVSFETDIEEGQFFPKMVMVDELRLQQVISNLVNNAIKFTDRGVVQLKAKWFTSPRVYSCWSLDDYPQLAESSGYLMLDVIDSGVGVDKKIIDAIFTSDKQQKEDKGLGLGLSITYQLVTLMGGQIRVVSDIGQGSVFSILLPLQKASDISELETSSSQGFLYEKKEVLLKLPQVLVVDDDRLGNMFITNICKSLKCHVDSAINGQQALDCIKKNTYDIVFLDIEMPVMNGIETIQRIRTEESLESLAKLKVVALTGHQGRDKELEGYGFSHVMTKPFKKSDIKKLFDAMEKA